MRFLATIAALVVGAAYGRLVTHSQEAELLLKYTSCSETMKYQDKILREVLTLDEVMNDDN